MIAPIRRGTARKLGLKLPTPDLVHVLEVDTSRLVWPDPTELTRTAQRLREAFRIDHDRVLASFQHIAELMRTGMQPPVDGQQEPNSCRWCAVPERTHYTRYKNPVGWHRWHVPTDDQRKARMLARREARR